MRLWDPATGELRLTFNGHTDGVRGLALHVRRADALFGRPRQHDPGVGPGDRVRAVCAPRPLRAVQNLAISPDGQTLASAALTARAYSGTLAAGSRAAHSAGHTDAINAVAFSPDGRLVATASSDALCGYGTPRTARSRRTLQGHIDEVYGLAFCPDGRLASSAEDKTIRLWDPASGQTC